MREKMNAQTLTKIEHQDLLDERSQEARIHLRCWEEVVGRFLGLERDDQWLIVKISYGILIFPVDSPEAQFLTEKLKGLSGRRVGILRTDLVEKPIVVKVMERDENSRKTQLGGATTRCQSL